MSVLTGFCSKVLCITSVIFGLLLHTLAILHLVLVVGVDSDAFHAVYLDSCSNDFDLKPECELTRRTLAATSLAILVALLQLIFSTVFGHWIHRTWLAWSVIHAGAGAVLIVILALLSAVLVHTNDQCIFGFFVQPQPLVTLDYFQVPSVSPPSLMGFVEPRDGDRQPPPPQCFCCGCCPNPIVPFPPLDCTDFLPPNPPCPCCDESTCSGGNSSSSTSTSTGSTTTTTPRTTTSTTTTTTTTTTTSTSTTTTTLVSSTEETTTAASTSSTNMTTTTVEPMFAKGPRPVVNGSGVRKCSKIMTLLDHCPLRGPTGQIVNVEGLWRRDHKANLIYNAFFSMVVVDMIFCLVASFTVGLVKSNCDESCPLLQ